MVDARERLEQTTKEAPDRTFEIPAFEAKGRKQWLKPTNIKGSRGRSDVSKTRTSWNHRNDRSRESGRNRSFALCSARMQANVVGLPVEVWINRLRAQRAARWSCPMRCEQG